MTAAEKSAALARGLLRLNEPIKGIEFIEELIGHSPASEDAPIGHDVDVLLDIDEEGLLMIDVYGPGPERVRRFIVRREVFRS